MTDVLVVPETTQHVLETDTGEFIEVTNTDLQVLTVQDQGPQGPPGDTTVAGSSMTYVATQTVGGHRVLAKTIDGLVYASNDDEVTLYNAIGVSTNAALIGEDVNITTYGNVTEPSWSWANGPVFLGANGQLTQVAPASGNVLVVGFAVTPQTLFVSIKQPVQLAG